MNPTTDFDFGTIMWLIGLASIDFYATVGVIAFGLYFNWITGIPIYLHPLGTPGAVGIFGLIWFIEHIVEKIPGVAIAWKWFHAIAKPIAILSFLLIVAFKMNSGTLALAIVPGLILTIIINLIYAKIWTVLGAIPVIPIFVTILEDIIIGLTVIKKIAPDATVVNAAISSFWTEAVTQFV
jgi:hypothetical protein